MAQTPTTADQASNITTERNMAPLLPSLVITFEERGSDHPLLASEPLYVEMNKSVLHATKASICSADCALLARHDPKLGKYSRWARRD